MEGDESNGENRYSCNVIVKPVEIHSKTERITIGGIDEIKENIILQVYNDTEDHMKGIMTTKCI
jgi:hypothetical protein